MAFLYYYMSILEFMLQVKALLQYHSHQLLGFVKLIFMAFFSLISLPNTPNYPLVNHEQNSTNTVITATDPTYGLAEENYEFNWSTSLIPLPLYHITDSIKNQLPVVEYSFFRLQNQKSAAGIMNSDDHELQHQHDECVVCLNPVEGTHLVRELSNCSHVFHKDCLDGWIDMSNVTCPLCRADLLPAAATSDQAGDLRNCPDGEDSPFSNLSRS